MHASCTCYLAHFYTSSKLISKITIIAEPKGEASNLDALSFCVGIYVCISAACAMQFYACVCISTTLVQLLCNQWPKCVPGDDYGPDYCLACVARILWKNTTTSISSPCPAHCAWHTISVSL